MSSLSNKVMRLMGKSSFFFVFVFSFSFPACQQPDSRITVKQSFSDVSEYDPEIRSFDFTEVFEDIRLIPLGSKKSPRIGKVDAVHELPSGFVVWSKGSAYYYSPEGEFIHTIFTQGKGPDEFLYPRILDVRGESEIVIADHFKSKEVLFIVNCQTRAIERVPLATPGRVHDLLVQNDTVLHILTEKLSGNPGQYAVLSLITQTVGGRLLREISVGSMVSNKQGPGRLWFAEGWIYLALPDVPSFFCVNEGVLDTVWQLKGSRQIHEPLSPGTYDQYSPISLTDDHLIYLHRKVEVDSRVLRFKPYDLLSVSKHTNTVSRLNIYLFSEDFPMAWSLGDYTGNGHLGKCIYPCNLLDICNVPEGKAFLESVFRRSIEPDLEDNPYILTASFKPSFN